MLHAQAPNLVVERLHASAPVSAEQLAAAGERERASADGEAEPAHDEHSLQPRERGAAVPPSAAFERGAAGSSPQAS